MLALAAPRFAWGQFVAAQPSVSLTAKSIFQGYQIQLDPQGNQSRLRDMNQLYFTLEGGAFALGPERQFDVVASFRYDADFGGGYSDGVFGSIPRFDGRHDADIIVLYLDWRRVLTDRIDLRIGRQIQLDDLDWYVHDGVKLMAHIWDNGEDRLELELYAGLPVRFDTLFASSEALLDDGSEVYDGEPPFSGAALGASLYFRLFRDVSLSVSWRNELNFRDDSLEGFGPAVNNNSDLDEFRQPIEGGLEERTLAASASEGSIGLQNALVGGSIGWQIRPLDLSLQATGVFNVLLDALDRVRAGAAWDPTRNLHLGVEYMRIRPSFSADSIFNWFNIFPYDRARIEGDWKILDDRLTLSASYFYQLFQGESVGQDRDTARSFQGDEDTHGPGGGLEWRERRYGLGLYAEGATNFGGRYAYGGNYSNASVFGDVNFLQQRLSFDLRLSTTTVQSDWFVGIDEGAVAEPETTYNIAIGARGRITEWLRARALYVQNIDPVVMGDYRVFTELAVLYR